MNTAHAKSTIKKEENARCRKIRPVAPRKVTSSTGSDFYTYLHLIVTIAHRILAFIQCNVATEQHRIYGDLSRQIPILPPPLPTPASATMPLPTPHQGTARNGPYSNLHGQTGLPSMSISPSNTMVGMLLQDMQAHN